jgi:uncharacterized membrane protein
MNISFLNKKDKFENRPKIRPEMEPVDWLLEVLAIAGLAVLFGYTIYWYQNLPEIIPTHFSAGGKIDGYGNRQTIFLLPGIGVFVYALLTLVALVPHTFNFPGKITPQNALRQYRLAIRLLRYLKVAIMLMFFVIIMLIVGSAKDMKVGKAIILLPFTFAMVFIPIIIYMVAATRK